MTPYHKIMRSLVAHGYDHEWRFGDRAWHNNREWVAVSIHSGGTMNTETQQSSPSKVESRSRQSISG